MYLETQRSSPFQFIDQHYVSSNDKADFIRTGMAYCAQRTHTKYISWLLTTRRIHEKKIKRSTAYLKSINILICIACSFSLRTKKNCYSETKETRNNYIHLYFILCMLFVVDFVGNIISYFIFINYNSLHKVANNFTNKLQNKRDF